MDEIVDLHISISVYRLATRIAASLDRNMDTHILFSVTLKMWMINIAVTLIPRSHLAASLDGAMDEDVDVDVDDDMDADVDHLQLLPHLRRSCAR